MKKIISITVAIVVCLLTFTSCSVKIDYTSAAELEKALNAGDDATGKTVSFIVDSVAPNSAFGYNLMTGEHLNFCSAKNPGVSAGDTVVAKITQVESSLGSFIIKYELKKTTKGSKSSQTTETTKQTTQETTKATTTKAATTEKKVSIDYPNVADFEKALNNGKDLIGKSVTLKAIELIPDSAFGYNITAGEHLNFCSSENPGVKAGETVSVKVKGVESTLGSFIISYEIIK